MTPDQVNLVSAIANLVTASSVLVLVWTLYLDHERTRRQTAVNLIFEWTRAATVKGTVARKFANTLDVPQSNALFRLEPLSCDATHLDLVASLIPSDIGTLVEANGRFALNRVQVSHLRFEIISYLNKLEAVLSSWRHNVADRDIIEEQFRFLFAPDDGGKFLPVLLSAAGDDYPAISEFKYELENRPPRRGREPLALLAPIRRFTRWLRG